MDLADGVGELTTEMSLWEASQVGAARHSHGFASLRNSARLGLNFAAQLGLTLPPAAHHLDLPPTRTWAPSSFPSTPCVQHAINAFRAVGELPASYIYNMSDFPEFRFLINNVPELISECGWDAG